MLFRRSAGFLLVLTLTASPLIAAPSIETAFSPRDDAERAIVRVIEEAHHNVQLAGYSFTAKPIAYALIAAQRRGVQVQVVLDGQEIYDKTGRKPHYSAASLLMQAQVPLKLDYRYAIMHNKFIVVDGVTVETGSFNFTHAAQHKNAENVIVLREYPALAARYLETWQGLWNEAEDPPAALVSESELYYQERRRPAWR